MPDRVKEKLVELFWEYDQMRMMRMSIEECVDRLVPKGVTVQEWISVKDRLPTLHLDDYQEPDGSRMQFDVSEDQWVITKTGYQTKARYETGVVFQGWVDDFGGTIRDVTHWMQLPQPPKGE